MKGMIKVKKFFFKGFAVAAAAAVAAVSFSGCGKQADDGRTVVTIWSPSSHSKATYTALTEEFNNTIGKENGIRVVYEVKEGDIGQQIELALASDQAPELFVAGKVSELAEKGQIVSLEDIGCNGLVEDYKDGLVEGTNTYKGKTYCIPVAATTRGLIYNKEMFKAAGIVDQNGEALPPATWDELREDAKKLTDASKKEYGIILPLKWSGWFSGDVIDAGIPSIGNNGYDFKTGKFDYYAYEPIINTYLGIKSDGSCLPGSESLDNDTARARFAEGGIGMKLGFSFDVAVLNDQFPAKIDWGVAPLPVLDKNSRYKQPASLGSSARINAAALNTVGAEKLKIVYDWLYSDEVIARAYQDSLNIPFKTEIIKNTTVENPKKGWVEFAKISDISTMIPAAAKYDISGEQALNELFMQEAWQGKKSAKDIISQYNKTVNAGVAKYKELHPEYDISADIYPEWDISLGD